MFQLLPNNKQNPKIRFGPSLKSHPKSQRKVRVGEKAHQQSWTRVCRSQKSSSSPENSPENAIAVVGRKEIKRKKENKKTKSKEEQLEEQEEVKLTFIVAKRGDKEEGRWRGNQSKIKTKSSRVLVGRQGGEIEGDEEEGGRPLRLAGRR